MIPNEKKIFEQDYQKYQRELYCFLYEILYSREEASELLQETFLTFFREQRKEIMPQEKKRPWLYKVAKNKALNILRKRKSQDKPLPKGEDNIPTPEQKLYEQQEVALVREVMGELREREALVLRLYSHDFNYDEMADIMQVEKSSIGKILWRAKKAFKKRYQERAQAEASLQPCL